MSDVCPSAKAGAPLAGKKEDDMMAANSDNAREHITLARAEYTSAVPHIVIAEDQPAIRDLLCWTLQLAGYRTAVCTGRHAAFTGADKKMIGGNVSVVVLLLDLSLLGTNEAEDFLHRLRTRWQEACNVLPQIIVLTTNTQVRVALGRRERVLQKPFHIRELLVLVGQAILVA